MALLDDMRVFAELARVGSFTGAARSLGLTKQTVSRRVRALERELGIELVRRTTRRVALTEVGRAYSGRCQEVTRLAEEANRAATSQLGVAAGTLRVTADATLGEVLLRDLVRAFAEGFPQVQVELLLTARKVDLLREGFDVAFRVGAPPDVHHLAARRLAAAALWWVATSGHLAAHGVPDDLGALARHPCLACLPDGAPAAWPVLLDGRIQMAPVEPRVRANDAPTVRAAALGGLGVAQLPSAVVRADVAAGRLVRVLAQHTPEVGGIHVVYPHSRLLAPKVTEFVALAVAMAGRLDGAELSPG
jgi:DNA-binding transcriptional LysR family regulator